MATMMKRSSLWLWLAISLGAPALYVAVAFAACGIGHGDCSLMSFFPALFPYALLFSQAFPNDIAVILLLALGQFPLYVIAWATPVGGKRHPLVRILLIGAHVAAAVLAFIS